MEERREMNGQRMMTREELEMRLPALDPSQTKPKSPTTITTSSRVRVRPRGQFLKANRLDPCSALPCTSPVT